MAFPKKNNFWTIFLSAPNAPPWKKKTNIIFIVVSPSLTVYKNSWIGKDGLRNVS